jgi:hypothetical protein
MPNKVCWMLSSSLEDENVIHLWLLLWFLHMLFSLPFHAEHFVSHVEKFTNPLALHIVKSANPLALHIYEKLES